LNAPERLMNALRPQNHLTLSAFLAVSRFQRFSLKRNSCAHNVPTKRVVPTTPISRKGVFRATARATRPTLTVQHPRALTPTMHARDFYDLQQRGLIARIVPSGIVQVTYDREKRLALDTWTRTLKGIIGEHRCRQGAAVGATARQGLGLSEARPSVVALAGPNGAGKSTTAPALLQGALRVTEFVNADDIARGLSAFNVEGAALAAGRVMLARLRELARQRISFAFETTLASRSFAPWLADLKRDGILDSHGLSVAAFCGVCDRPRCRSRAHGRALDTGGDDSPALRQRHSQLLQTVRASRLDLAVYDNSEEVARLIAERVDFETLRVTIKESGRRSSG
jgi:predicted ABC-type ATPase